MFSETTLSSTDSAAIANGLNELRQAMAQNTELPIEVRLNSKLVISATVLQISGELAIPFDAILAARLPLKAPPKSYEGSDYLLLSDIGFAAFSYVAEAARLDVYVDPKNLLPQTFSAPRTPLPTPNAVPALLTNYDWSVVRDQFSGAPAITSNGINVEHVLSFGALRFNQSWRSSRSNPAAAIPDLVKQTPFRRVDSFVQFDQPDKIRSWILGDQQTVSQGLARSVRSFGLTVRRNFNGRPEIITKPRPSLNGFTVEPTTYELYVDSIKRGTGNIEEGFFDFASSVEGLASGNVRLVTTDTLGRETVVVAPFFFSPSQLATNTTDYALHVGKQRTALNGRRSDYGPSIFLAEYGVGISDAWTLRLLTEATPDFYAAALRSVHSLWGRGTVMIDTANSRTSGLGNGYMQNIQVNGRWQSMFWGASYYNRTKLFQQIGDSSIQNQIRSKQIATISAGYRPKTGISAAILTTRERRFDGSAVFTVRPSLFYSLTPFQSLSLSLSYLKDGKSSFRSAFLVWTYRPPVSNIIASSVVNHSNDQTALTVGAERQLNNKSPYQYRLATTKGNGTFSEDVTEASVGFRGEAIETTFNFRRRQFGQAKTLTLESRGTGTIVATEYGMFASSRALDSAVLVKIGDIEGVGITDGGTTASTNSAGFALLPSAVGLQRNRLFIEASDVPIEVEYEGEPIEVVPWPKSVARVDKGVSQIEGSAWVIQQAGSPVPLATSLLVNENESVFVGIDGALYLPFDAEGKEIKAKLPNGETCTVSFPKRPESVSRAEPLIAQCGLKQ